MGAGNELDECEVLGRPLSKEVRWSCRGVISPGDWDTGAIPNPFSLWSDLFSKRRGQPLWPSSSGRLTPLSFHGLR